MVILGIIAAGMILIRYERYHALDNVHVPTAVDFSQLKTFPPSPFPSITFPALPSSTPVASSQVPQELNLQMTFYPQAPLANWDLPWQEACEEASVLLIANEYQRHQWTVEQFNQQILQMVDWENKTFGDYKHTTMAQTAKILNQYLHLQTKIYRDPDLATIKKVLAKGHFIVMPFAGKELANPYYKNGGPVYHVFVIKGFTADNHLIANDVGTKRGENDLYAWTLLQSAMHDYAEPIDQGAKEMIEVLPLPSSP